MDDIKITPPADDDPNHPASEESDMPGTAETSESNDAFRLGVTEGNIKESVDPPKPATDAFTNNVIEGMIGAEEGARETSPITPPELASTESPREVEDTSEEESIMKAATATEAGYETTGGMYESETKKKFPLWLAILIAVLLIAVVVLAAMYFNDGWPFKGQIAVDDSREAADDQQTEEEAGAQFCPEGYYLPLESASSEEDFRTDSASDAMTNTAPLEGTRTSTVLMGSLGSIIDTLDEPPTTDMVYEVANETTGEFEYDSNPNGDVIRADSDVINLTNETSSGIDSMWEGETLRPAADAMAVDTTSDASTTIKDSNEGLTTIGTLSNGATIAPGSSDAAYETATLGGGTPGADMVLDGREMTTAEEAPSDAVGLAPGVADYTGSDALTDGIIKDNTIGTMGDYTLSDDDEETSTGDNDFVTVDISTGTMDETDDGKFDVSLCRPIPFENLTPGTNACTLIMDMSFDPDAYFINDATKRSLESLWVPACTSTDDQLEEEIVSCVPPQTLNDAQICECPEGFNQVDTGCEMDCSYFQDIVDELGTSSGDPTGNTASEIQRLIEYGEEYGCEINEQEKEVTVETDICQNLFDSMRDALLVREMRGFMVTADRAIEEGCPPEMDMCDETLTKSIIAQLVINATPEEDTFELAYFQNELEQLRSDYYANPVCNNVDERCEEIRNTIVNNTSDAIIAEDTTSNEEEILTVDALTAADDDSTGDAIIDTNANSDYLSTDFIGPSGETEEQSPFGEEQFYRIVSDVQNEEIGPGDIYKDNTIYFGENCTELEIPGTRDVRPTTEIPPTAPPGETPPGGRGAAEDDGMVSPALADDEEDGGAVLPDLGDDDTPTAGGSAFQPPATDTGSTATPTSSITSPPSGGEPTAVMDTSLPPTTVLTPPPVATVTPPLHGGAPEVTPPTPQPVIEPVITPATPQPEKPADMPPEITPTGPETLIYLFGLVLAQLYLFRRKIYAYVKGK